MRECPAAGDGGEAGQCAGCAPELRRSVSDSCHLSLTWTVSRDKLLNGLQICSYWKVPEACQRLGGLSPRI